jgi:hypothetical protein
MKIFDRSTMRVRRPKSGENKNETGRGDPSHAGQQYQKTDQDPARRQKEKRTAPSKYKNQFFY